MKPLWADFDIENTVKFLHFLLNISWFYSFLVSIKTNRIINIQYYWLFQWQVLKFSW